MVLTLYSVGHLIVDTLANRLGIKLSNQKGGYAGHGQVHIGETLVSLTLFKSSMSSIFQESLPHAPAYGYL